MPNRRIMIVVLLLVALPSVLYGRWIKDVVSLQTDEVGKVEFSHYTHMEMESVGKNCPTCHNDVYHIVTKKNPAFTMAQMEDGKACGVCHNGKKAFSVSGDCTTCHAGEISIRTENVGNVNFSHDVHVDMDFGCDDCHPDLFEPESSDKKITMAAMEDGEACGACHDGDTAFGVAEDCTTCHAGDILYKNEDAGNITFPHQAHLDMDFGCDDCHPDIFNPQRGTNQVTMEDMENGEACGACHDGDTAFSVAEDCESCHEM